MSQLRANIIANFSGAGWTALVQLVAIPLYIRFMGIESYGLVGIYITLIAVLQILDFGLSSTMNREMARYSVQHGKEQEARDFVRTLETCSWVTGLAAGLLVASSSHLIATHWLKAGALPTPLVRQSLLLMGGLATRHGVTMGNGSFYGAIAQGTFTLTTSRDQHGYDPANNIYFARPGDIGDMSTALGAYIKRRIPRENDFTKQSWDEIDDTHIQFYTSTV